MDTQTTSSNTSWLSNNYYILLGTSMDIEDLLIDLAIVALIFILIAFILYILYLLVGALT